MENAKKRVLENFPEKAQRFDMIAASAGERASHLRLTSAGEGDVLVNLISAKSKLQEIVIAANIFIKDIEQDILALDRQQIEEMVRADAAKKENAEL